MVTKSPAWKQFEDAVAAFIKTLAGIDPSAKVVPNAKLPDRHTGKKRQRDVWIELKAVQLFHISILVSCKRYNRTLHEGDIDTFHGELLSSRAHKGVLYSYSGFGDDAVTKAKELGICCCRLYENEPADLPKSLILGSQYCCHARLGLGVSPTFAAWGIAKWSELFEMTTKTATGEMKVLQAVVEEFHRGESSEMARLKEPGNKNPIPNDWKTGLRIEDIDGGKPPLEIAISGTWIFFAAKIEAILLNGSYSVTSNEYVGSQTSPVIDTQGYTPGPSWELLDTRPIHTGESCLIAVRYNTEAKQERTVAIGEAFGPLRLDGK